MNIKDLVKVLNKYIKKDPNTKISIQLRDNAAIELEKENITFDENDGFPWGESWLTFTVHPKKRKNG